MANSSRSLDVGHLEQPATDFSAPAAAPPDPFGFDPDLAAQTFLVGQPHISGMPAKDNYGRESGDSTQTAQDAYDPLAYATEIAKDPSRIKDLQQKLHDAGFSIDVTGSFDSKTVNALEEVIRQSIRDGISIDEVFVRLKQSGGDKTQGRDLEKEGQNRYLSELLSTYFSIWGKAPPPGYLERVAASGMNTFEFGFYERSKPAYKSSPEYKNMRFQSNDALARHFGYLR